MTDDRTLLEIDSTADTAGIDRIVAAVDRMNGSFDRYARSAQGINAASTPAAAGVEKVGVAAEKSKGRLEQFGITGERVAKGMAVGVGAILAIATKGAVELGNAVANFRGETGATEAEAKSAQGAIAELYRGNLITFQAAGETLAALRTDMGLTQAGAEAVAQSYVDFGKVAKLSGADSVRQFDDVLDAFGLTAADAAGLMDVLVASHQEFGGSIQGNLGALKSMAPALQALNVSLETGNGLLNLFAKSGLDAGAVQRGLNSAVTKMPKGETFDAFIARIAAIPEAGKRAEAAIEVMGSKAGNALANALAPGKGALEDYIVTAGEVPGVAGKAAEAIDSSFGVQSQLMIRQFTSRLAELGAQFGPLATGMASIATLAVPMVSGIGSALKKGLGPAVGGAFASLKDTPAGAAGGRLGGAFVKGMKGVALLGIAVMAAEMVEPLNDAGSDLFAPLIGQTGQGTLKRVSAELAAFAADTGQSFDVVARQAYDLKGRLNITLQEAARLTMAGIAQFAEGSASALGNAYAGSLASGFDYETMTEAGRKAGEAIVDGTEDGLGTAGAKLAGPFGAIVEDALRKPSEEAAAYIGIGLPKAIAEQWAAKAPTIEEAARVLMSPAGAAVENGIVEAALIAARYPDDIAARLAEGRPKVDAAAGELVGGIAVAIDSQSGPVVETADAMMIRAADRMRANAEKWISIGEGVPSGIGEGMMQKSLLVVDGMETLLNILEHGLTPAQQAARVMGEKYGANLTRGLKSKIPGAQQQAKEVGLAAIIAIENAPGKGKTKSNRLHRAGEIYAELVGAGMSSEQIALALKAAGVSDKAIAALSGKKQVTAAKKAGKDLIVEAKAGVNSVDLGPTGSAAGQDMAHGINSSAARAAALAAGAALLAYAQSFLNRNPAKVKIEQHPNVTSGGRNQTSSAGQNSQNSRAPLGFEADAIGGGAFIPGGSGFAAGAAGMSAFNATITHRLEDPDHVAERVGLTPRGLLEMIGKGSAEVTRMAQTMTHQFEVS